MLENGEGIRSCVYQVSLLEVPCKLDRVGLQNPDDFRCCAFLDIFWVVSGPWILQDGTLWDYHYPGVLTAGASESSHFFTYCGRLAWLAVVRAWRQFSVVIFGHCRFFWLPWSGGDFGCQILAPGQALGSRIVRSTWEIADLELGLYLPTSHSREINRLRVSSTNMSRVTQLLLGCQFLSRAKPNWRRLSWHQNDWKVIVWLCDPNPLKTNPFSALIMQGIYKMCSWNFGIGATFFFMRLHFPNLWDSFSMQLHDFQNFGNKLVMQLQYHIQEFLVRASRHFERMVLSENCRESPTTRTTSILPQEFQPPPNGITDRDKLFWINFRFHSRYRYRETQSAIECFIGYIRCRHSSSLAHQGTRNPELYLEDIRIVEEVSFDRNLGGVSLIAGGCQLPRQTSAAKKRNAATALLIPKAMLCQQMSISTRHRLSEPISQWFMRSRLRCPLWTQKSLAISETRQTNAALRCKGAMWSRWQFAIFWARNPFCGISCDWLPSTRKSLAIAIVRFVALRAWTRIY